MQEYSKDLLVQGKQFSVEALYFKERFRMPLPHYHSHYELLYLPVGKRKLFVGENAYEVSERNIALIHPYVLHRSESASSEEAYRFLLDFTPELAEELKQFSEIPDFLCLHSDSPCISLTASQSEKIHKLFQTILTLPEEDSRTTFLRKVHLCEILILLSETVKREENSSTVPQRMTEIARFLERHHKENITLESVAEEFFLSPWYLSRTFKKYMGIGINGYLNNLRILSAQKMLEDPKCTVTQAALACGFDNITHFGRVFHKLVGTSPKKFQKTSII